MRAYILELWWMCFLCHQFLGQHIRGCSLHFFHLEIRLEHSSQEASRETPWWAQILTKVTAVAGEGVGISDEDKERVSVVRAAGPAC